MTNKLYVVTFDGYCEDYGSHIYLLGVYDTLAKASEVIEKAIEDCKDYETKIDHEAFTITECEVNSSFDIKSNGCKFFPEFVTDAKLGGYAE